MTETSYLVTIRRVRVDYHRQVVEADSEEAAVDRVLMSAPGEPSDWSVDEVKIVDGPTEHIEPGAISFT
jgi:hypothetical protein